MADNVAITAGTGTTVHADEYTHSTLGSGKTQLSAKDFKIDQALWSSLLAGAIAAVFKALRDDIGDPSDPNVINRLPL